MKGKIFRITAAAAALTLLIAPSVSRVYSGRATGDTYILDDGIDPDSAKIKPILALSRIELPLNEARANPERIIELSVSGAEGKYGPTGLHIEFDERLKLKKLDGEYAEKGPALKRIGAGVSQEDMLDENGEPHCVFVITGGSENKGRDGVMWTFCVELPEDVKEGDLFPIQIAYRKGNSTGDLFTNREQDKDGRLMEAWVFTRGIEHGYIKITDIEEKTTVPNVAEEARGPKAGDLNGDGFIDAVDASCILSGYAMYSTGKESPEEEDFITGDVNENGLIDAVDASIVLAYYAYTSASGELGFDEFVDLKM